AGPGVADGGMGSNFITSGKFNDTIFHDARGATTDVWNTIQNFHPGDATTLWGVTENDFNFAWAGSEGNSKALGLTLHATPKSGIGPEISVTFAGHSMADLGSLSM